MNELLTDETARWLPIGTVVEITWSGGNGPHQYVVVCHSVNGRCGLAPVKTMNWLDSGGPLGPKPQTEARIIITVKEPNNE